jgi:U3 small nucleolar RNA-associated protein 23
MRHGRAKAGRKTLRFYSINALINAPYKVVLDGNFIAASLKQKVPLFERLQKLLGTNQFKIHVTRSTLNELAELPGELFQSARQFGLDECEILEQSQIDQEKKQDQNKIISTPSTDIISLVKGNNPEGYFVATQDEQLSDKLREMVFVPQMRLVRAVLILESPSAASRRHAMFHERTKQSTGGLMTEDEKELVQKMKQKLRDDKKKLQEATAPIERRKQKAKGPNPLSCKKRKLDEKVDGEKKKRTRRRKKKSSEEN